MKDSISNLKTWKSRTVEKPNFLTGIPIIVKEEYESPYEVETVGVMDRIIHFAIDNLLITVISFVLLWGLNFFFAESSSIFSEEGPSDILITLTVLMVYFLYFFIFEVFSGSTPGKKWMNHVVIDENCNYPDFITTFIRSLFRFIPFDFVFCFAGRGLHDSLSGTWVVNVREKEKIEKMLREKTNQQE